MQLQDSLPDFDLIATDNSTKSPADYADKKAVLIIFTCNHCPYARAYIERISNLVQVYEEKGLGIYAINSNDPKKYPEDSFERMIPMAEALHLRGKYLFDETQEVARAFGAQRTPEVFLFNDDRQLVYSGAIDDNYDDANAVEEPYLVNAIDALLNNDEITTTSTDAVGCSIKWK